MSDNLKNLLDDTIPREWTATGADSATAIVAGSALRRRRRAATTGASALAIAGLATAVALTMAPGSPTEDAPAAAGGPTVAPELDPEAHYYWASDPDGEYDEGLRSQYEAALSAYFDEDHPDVPNEGTIVLTGEARVLVRDVDGDDNEDRSEALLTPPDPDDEVVLDSQAFVLGVDDGSGEIENLTLADGSVLTVEILTNAPEDVEDVVAASDICVIPDPDSPNRRGPECSDDPEAQWEGVGTSERRDDGSLVRVRLVAHDLGEDSTRLLDDVIAAIPRLG